MKCKKTIMFFLILILIVISDKLFGWSEFLGSSDILISFFNNIKENFLLTSLIYVFFTAFGCVVLALPGITFAIIAGMIFNPFVGTLLCSIATTIGAAFAFLAGRYFLKDSVKPLAEKNSYIKKLLFSQNKNSEIIVLMITRLVPLFPFNLQNFAYGITDIGFWKYTILSFVFMLPGTALFTLGAGGIVNEENRILYAALALIIGIIIFFMCIFMKKKYLVPIDKQEEH